MDGDVEIEVAMTFQASPRELASRDFRRGFEVGLDVADQFLLAMGRAADVPPLPMRWVASWGETGLMVSLVERD